MNIDTSSIASTSGPGQIWSGASAGARMPASQKMSSLFDQIDSSGSGSITQSQFDQAFQTLNPPKDFKAQGADATWAQLDPAGTGSVSKQDFVTGMTAMMRQMRAGVQDASTSSQSPNQTVSASSSALQSLTTGTQLNITV